VLQGAQHIRQRFTAPGENAFVVGLLEASPFDERVQRADGAIFAERRFLGNTEELRLPLHVRDDVEKVQRDIAWCGRVLHDVEHWRIDVLVPPSAPDVVDFFESCPFFPEQLPLTLRSDCAQIRAVAQNLQIHQRFANEARLRFEADEIRLAGASRS
jgi:hypothetical protein